MVELLEIKHAFLTQNYAKVIDLTESAELDSHLLSLRGMAYIYLRSSNCIPQVKKILSQLDSENMINNQLDALLHRIQGYLITANYLEKQDKKDAILHPKNNVCTFPILQAPFDMFIRYIANSIDIPV